MIEKERQYNTSRSWNLLLNHIKEDKPLTTFEVSRICGVNHASVSLWIDQQKLNAFRTPGGHRRVKCSDLLLFLKLHQIPVPKELEATLSQFDIPTNESPIASQTDLKPKVLVVIRENPSRDVVFEILKRSYPQYDFQCASDLYTFGKKVGEVHPNVIVVDLNLEGSDSSRILENVRNDQDLLNTKIIVIMENKPQQKHHKMVTDFSVDAMVVKPVKVDELKQKLESLIKG